MVHAQSEVKINPDIISNAKASAEQEIAQKAKLQEIAKTFVDSIKMEVNGVGFGEVTNGRVPFSLRVGHYIDLDLYFKASGELDVLLMQAGAKKVTTPIDENSEEDLPDLTLSMDLSDGERIFYVVRWINNWVYEGYIVSNQLYKDIQDNLINPILLQLNRFVWEIFYVNKEGVSTTFKYEVKKRTVIYQDSKWFYAKNNEHTWHSDLGLLANVYYKGGWFIVGANNMYKTSIRDMDVIMPFYAYDNAGDVFHTFYPSNEAILPGSIYLPNQRALTTSGLGAVDGGTPYDKEINVLYEGTFDIKTFETIDTIGLRRAN
jgi:hypothetical protein